jgi:putative salt-induced outer membrane protein
MLGEKVYSYVGTNYIKDQLSDYDYRLNIGPGIGYKFIDDEIQTLDIQGGLDYAFDKYNDNRKDEYIAPRTEIDYRYKFDENIEFKQMLNYLISIEDSEKYFMSSETSMGVRMTKNLSLGVSYRIDYVNKTEKENTDKKFLTSLIMDF